MVTVDPWIWTSGPVAGNGSPALVAVVVNPSDSAFRYGVHGTIERGDDGGWTPAGSVVSSLDGWGGFGRLTAPDGRRFVPRVGLGAAAGGVGEAEYISLEGLPAGRYRLSHHESYAQGDASPRVARGSFTVAESMGSLVTVEVPAFAAGGQSEGPGSTLVVRPLLVPLNGAVVSVAVKPFGSSTPESRRALDGQLSRDLVGRPWTGRQWAEPRFAVPTVTRAVPGFDKTETVAVLPPLEAGPYKLSRQHAAGQVSRVVWASSDLPAAQPLGR